MSAENNALGIYLTKFDDWKYCPPSDHLWTVSFFLAPRGGKDEIGTFQTLYNNILNVNNQYNASFSPLWKITTPGDSDFVINSQDSTIGMFLASEITFNGNSVIIADTQSNNATQYTGWLSYGKTLTGRNHNHAAKIIFFKSNWDITEIFIDRWIAAIGQQGLIEDSSLYNIKANIVITEYAASVPSQTTAGVWVPRKKVTLLRAFPKSRLDNKYEYSPEEAGSAKFNTVDFEFDAYQIEYFDVGLTRKPRGGTPGYISPTTAVGTSEVGPTLTVKDVEKLYPNSK
ncbi:MAG: hypothetical protein IJ341_12655 [Bacteroidales bacterium]|nr:hypothetical protein [Bacteroidales bacterium]